MIFGVLLLLLRLFTSLLFLILQIVEFLACRVAAQRMPVKRLGCGLSPYLDWFPKLVCWLARPQWVLVFGPCVGNKSPWGTKARLLSAVQSRSLAGDAEVWTAPIRQSWCSTTAVLYAGGSVAPLFQLDLNVTNNNQLFFLKIMSLC